MSDDQKEAYLKTLPLGARKLASLQGVGEKICDDDVWAMALAETARIDGQIDDLMRIALGEDGYQE